MPPHGRRRSLIPKAADHSLGEVGFRIGLRLSRLGRAGAGAPGSGLLGERATLDRQNGSSRSHRDTEMRQNEIGAARVMFLCSSAIKIHLHDRCEFDREHFRSKTTNR